MPTTGQAHVGIDYSRQPDHQTVSESDSCGTGAGCDLKIGLFLLAYSFDRPAGRQAGFVYKKRIFMLLISSRTLTFCILRAHFLRKTTDDQPVSLVQQHSMSPLTA